jgi:hypothetical protein
MTPLAPDLWVFLQKNLPDERGASRHTIAAYAHAFILLQRFAAARLKRQASDLAIEDLDVRLIRGFVEHTEEGRANTVRSRNARLAAIKAFFRFLEPRRPACLEQAMMVRALPVKRTDVKLIDYLMQEEVRRHAVTASSLVPRSAYARSLALRNQTLLPWEVQRDRRSLNTWIEAQARLKPVSDMDRLPRSKQVAFAEKLARVNRRAVPDECFRDKGLMSEWIDGNQ